MTTICPTCQRDDLQSLAIHTGARPDRAAWCRFCGTFIRLDETEIPEVVKDSLARRMSEGLLQWIPVTRKGESMPTAS